ncbi:four helix bundle suffix domain-containing protein [Candidatus Sumerlaeota bacterium]
MPDHEPLIPQHGGYRKLKSFQVAQLAFDVTVHFCQCYVDKFSRTRDQMTQAARSGVQNIAEGSQASGTSKKTELKLTNVARASLEDLRLDYEDFLRQRGLALLPPDHPALMRFKKRRCATLMDVRRWVAEEIRRQGVDGHGRSGTDTDNIKPQQSVPVGDHSGPSVSVPERPCSSGAVGDGPVSSVPVGDRPCSSLSPEALAANGALSLLNLACYLLDRQLAAQAKAFENEGGFTERLYRVRSERRRR